MLLGNAGLSSDYAVNGKIAIKMVLDKNNDESCNCFYQLILMDCNMPVMDGYTACKKLRKMIK